MKITTKGRYGAAAAIDLAQQYGAGGFVQLKDMARRQRISIKYLEQIMAALCGAKLVKGRKGKNGGYSLALPPENIRLSDVLTALEGSIAPTRCVQNVKACFNAKNCVLFGVWLKLKEAVAAVLSSYTLKDLAVEAQKKSEALDLF